MAIKPEAKDCVIKEQIIEDGVTGLTLQFDALSDGTTRLNIIGDLEMGNRSFIFNKQGEEAGAGTALGGTPRPSWLKDVS